MPTPTAPLDNLETAVNTARVRLLDAIQAISGDIVTDTAAFTLTAINGAWRRLQELLVNFGCPWLTIEAILSSVPLVTSADPGSQVSINWSNYFDGTNNQAAPVLPQNLIVPIKLWERAHAGAGSFFPMDKLTDGIPAIPKLAFNKNWEWLNGAIVMPGASQITDIRLRYSAFYADFVAPGTTAFNLQLIPIVRSLNAFAWLICAEVAKPRGDLDAGDFEQKGQMAARYIIELDPTQDRVNTEIQSTPVVIAPPEKG